MEKDTIKQKILEIIQKSKLKSITLEEIYKLAEIVYSPEIAKQIDTIVKELIEENLLEPFKTSKKNVIGTPLKYRIIKIEKDYVYIKEEISKLYKKIDIKYYLKHPEEYEQHRKEILQINDFMKIEDKGKVLTVNERSYQIFKDEKKLKEQESILKKLGLTFKDLNCYETYEPFFYFENNQYNKKVKTILIIENRDTFWTFKKVAKLYNTFYLVIYGEGKKILNSFEYIKNFKLEEDTKILYFGDIDYEGINIYVSLVQNYKNYQILPYTEAYQKMLELETNPNKVKKNQNIRKDSINEFLKYFSKEEKDKLKYIFENNFYIPQEIINYEEVEKIVWKN